MEKNIAYITKRSKRLIVAVSYLSIGMLGVYISLYQYTVLSISQLFLLNAALMGVLIALQSLGNSMPPLFLGMLSAKIGKRKVVLISYSLMILGTLLAGITQSLPAFIVSVFIIGAGLSVMEGTLSAVLADEFPEESTRHLNFSQVAFSTGAMSGPFIAQALIENGVYFKDLFIYVSVVFAALMILFCFTRQFSDNARPIVGNNSVKVSGFFKTRVFLLLAFSIFLYVGVENTTANFSDSYFELVLGKPALSAAALSLFWCGMIPSRFLAGILRVGLKKLFTVLAIVVFVSLIGAMLIPDNTIKIILFFTCGFGCGPLWPLLMDAAAKRYRGNSAPALNIMMTFSGLGGAVLPLVSGMVVNKSSQTSAYFLSAAACALMLAVYLASYKNNAATQERQTGIRNNMQEEQDG
jgi:fucose permease